eukprot:TRINITY_DN1806_c0_g1_i12.p2 TRINITY_DN1806_c0_g1~~TRINITY_DN1806_c0_g1_i12.p2  ORF type:complete len:253 (-),score=-14.22 TRINITY_DN1806_c0_g1_i12:1428-2186(-)
MNLQTLHHRNHNNAFSKINILHRNKIMCNTGFGLKITKQIKYPSTQLLFIILYLKKPAQMREKPTFEKSKLVVDKTKQAISNQIIRQKILQKPYRPSFLKKLLIMNVDILNVLQKIYIKMIHKLKKQDQLQAIMQKYLQGNLILVFLENNTRIYTYFKNSYNTPIINVFYLCQKLYLNKGVLYEFLKQVQIRVLFSKNTSIRLPCKYFCIIAYNQSCFFNLCIILMYIFCRTFKISTFMISNFLRKEGRQGF